MAFLTPQELGSAIYGYQVEQITENNDDIVLEAIETATEEVRSYIELNNQRENLDGRPKYDVNQIFDATGNERNALILAYTKTVAKWWIVQLCNADIIYEQAKERYDRATNWLDKLSKGEVNLSTLPILPEPVDDPTTTDDDYDPWRWGSRPKFNHE